MAVFTVNNSNNRFTLKLTLTEGTPSVANNNSPVSYKLELIANTSYHFTDYAIGSKVVMDGETVHNQVRTASVQYSISSYGRITLASGSKTITHDADGSKKIAVEFSIDMASADYTAGALSGSGDMELTTILRQATITSATDFTDEENPTVNYTNPLGDSVSALQVCIATDSSTIVVPYRDISKTGNSYTFVLTDDERTALRNATKTSKTLSVFFYIKTTNGGTNYYSKAEQTLTIVNANPIFTEEQVAYADNSSFADITENPLHIVQNKSPLTVIFGAAQGNKGASITKYELTLNGVTKTINADTSAGYSLPFGTVNSSQDLTLSVKAIDGRGNSTTVKKKVIMLAYDLPIMSAVVERLNNFEDTTYLTPKASISSVNGKNEATITFMCKRIDGDYGEPETIENNARHTVTCDKNYAYLFSVTVADVFGGSDTKEYPLAKGVLPLFVNTERNAVGINDFPAENEALRVAGGVARFMEGIVLNSATKSFKITINDSGTLQIAEIK